MTCDSGSCGPTILDMLESRELTEEAYWCEKKQHKRLAYEKTVSVEELETLPAGKINK